MNELLAFVALITFCTLASARIIELVTLPAPDLPNLNVQPTAKCLNNP